MFNDGQSPASILRGHLGIPDAVFEHLIVPLNYLVILHLIPLNLICTQICRGKHLDSLDIVKNLQIL